MFDLIAVPFGWVMRLIYQVVHNYGISIILFTLFVKLLTLPSTYKTQVNQARMGLIAEKVQKLKKSFPNNPTRLQEEQNKLYQEEGINPSAGCLGSFLTIFLVLGVYRVVIRPMTFILRFTSGEISDATAVLKEWMTNNNVAERTIKLVDARPELTLLQYWKSNPEIFSGVEGFADKVRDFDNSFLGLDLTGIPSFKPEGGWSFAAVLLILLPVLAAVVNLIMTFVTQHHTKKTNPAAQSMGAMNAMLYLSPLLTIWFGMTVPAGLSLYWLINSLLSLLLSLLLYQYLKGARLEKINAKEKEKQLAKGPTWMQRMMEQSAQMQAQQNGQQRDGNRTRYSDGDDGMSRKERAEYERKLIEAARKRAALKYGEELPEQDSDEE